MKSSSKLDYKEVLRGIKKRKKRKERKKKKLKKQKS
jgi:hypothetical protein